MIYLDYNATTPVAPEVFRALRPYLEAEFGNPSCDYPLGLESRDAVRRAREEVAALLGCAAEAIVFTSGATEANNTVFKGVATHHGRGRIITVATEHPAVLAPCRYLQSQGFQVTILPVDGAGRLDPEAVRRALTPDTILISVMHANNETGALQPLREIGALARKAGVAFHTDAAQSVGKVPVHVDELQVDFLTVAGHKFYAPKGVGALYVRPGSNLVPLLHGASQEGGRRAGTENVPYMVALGAACRLARERLPNVAPHLQGLRDRLHDLLRAGVPGLILNGPKAERLPNTLNVSFPGLAGCDLMAGVPELAASLGSACHAGREAVSPVLAAMGVPAAVARGAVRFSVGFPTTLNEVDAAAARLLECVGALTRH
ncbi:MAG: cysteine desulfurase [Syntrophobacterales bacterium]|jgi:cysteine desulfurase|nr:cysteine desulfurase [Syntrophobacterales bacterium]